MDVAFIIRFPGQYYDEETGLHYNWHRYYDPSIGRYISADPIGQAGGINLYNYALNSPTNLIDPDGLITLQDVASFAAGFGDTLSFGLTSAINDATGASSVVDPCSGAFAAGEASGFGLGLALGAAGVAKAAGGGLARAGAGSVDDLLKGATKVKPGKSVQFEKSGSANKAFDKLARGSKVKDQGNGIRSTTTSEGKIGVRPTSGKGGTGPPTVQVNPHGGGPAIKVRFSER